jgi:phosphate/sulfate permease
VSFSHGANDIANSIGSFTAAFYTWQNSKVRPVGWLAGTHSVW